jgi:hypothetical protein
LNKPASSKAFLLTDAMKNSVGVTRTIGTKPSHKLGALLPLEVLHARNLPWVLPLFFLSMIFASCSGTTRDVQIIAPSDNQLLDSKGRAFIEEQQGVFLSSVLVGRSKIPYHTTILRECGLPAARNQASTTRQLLVGFDDLVIESSDALTLGSTNVLRTFASAGLDGAKLSLIVYSHHANGCVSDYVLWFQNNNKTKARNAIMNSYEHHLPLLLKNQDLDTPTHPSALALDKKISLAHVRNKKSLSQISVKN